MKDVFQATVVGKLLYWSGFCSAADCTRLNLYIILIFRPCFKKLMMRCFIPYCVTHHTSFTRFCLSGQKQHTHCELEVTINYSFQKLATLVIDTLSLGLSTKTYTDVIKHTKPNLYGDTVTYRPNL